MWTNFLDMIMDVHRHVRVTGVPVELCEDPSEGVFGYRARTGETWTISLDDLKHSLFEVNSGKAFEEIYVIRKCITTASGRFHLANYILD